MSGGPGNKEQPASRATGSEFFELLAMQSGDRKRSNVLSQTAQILAHWEVMGPGLRAIPVGHGMTYSGNPADFREINEYDVMEDIELDDEPIMFVVNPKNPTLYIMKGCGVLDLQDASEGCEGVNENSLEEILSSSVYRLTIEGMKAALEDLVIEEDEEEEDEEEEDEEEEDEEEDEEKPKADILERSCITFKVGEATSCLEFEEDDEKWMTLMLHNAEEVTEWHLTDDGRQILRALIAFMNPSEATMKAINLLYGEERMQHDDKDQEKRKRGELEENATKKARVEPIEQQ